MKQESMQMRLKRHLQTQRKCWNFWQNGRRLPDGSVSRPGCCGWVPLEKEAETIEKACTKQLEGIVEDTEKKYPVGIKNQWGSVSCSGLCYAHDLEKSRCQRHRFTEA